MERVQALVASPEPLIRLLGRRLGAPAAGADPVLEVLTRRYYRRRSLENLRAFLLDGRTCVTGDYELNGQRLHLVAMMAQSDEPARGARRRWRRSWPRPRTRHSWSSTSTSPGRTGRRTPTSWPTRLREQLVGHRRAAAGPAGDRDDLHPGRRRRDADLPAVAPTAAGRGAGHPRACTR